MSTEERFWVKVEKSEACWEWRGAIGTHGYGNFWLGEGRYVRAHRFAYELARGPVASGLVLDHLCRNRRCVNPDHLEPVTQRVNVERGVSAEMARQRKAEQTVCKHNHPLAGDNLYIQPKTGYRYCRTCQRRRDLAYKARRMTPTSSRSATPGRAASAPAAPFLAAGAPGPTSTRRGSATR